MIGFLSPIFLLAAAAAAIPLFIHLLRRRIGTRVEFPAVRYLARAEREHSRKLRLRNLLLMLLRVVAVLVVAAAAARPVARLAGGGHAPTALAIVLDNSLSTTAIAGGRSVLDDLKEQARALVRRATPDDRLWLVTADGVVHGGPASSLLAALDRVEPLAGAGDPPAAVARARALVQQRALLAREVALLTDAQATSWPEPVSLGDLRVAAYRPAGAPPVNRAVIEAGARPARWTPRGAATARVLAPDSTTYRISLEGRTLARGTVTRDEEVVLRASPVERGWTAGMVEIAPDELRGDDVRHFAVWIGPAPSVAVYPSLGPFAQSAVEALTHAERVTRGHDVAFAPADEPLRLPALIVAPADPVRLGAANRALERLSIPWRLGPARRGEAAARAAAGAPAMFEGVTVSLRYALLPRGAASADTLALVAGEPWIVGGPGYVLVGSPLVPDATSFPVRASFVPWLSDVITQRLSDDAGAVLAAAPRAPIRRPPGVDALETVGGHRRALAGDTLTAPDRPGTYFFSRGGRRVGALVVNFEAAEARLERLDEATLTRRLGGREARTFTDGTRWASAVFASAPRRPIAVPLLVIALVTLLAESALAGAGRRRAA